MTDKYKVGEITSNVNDDPIVEGWAAAMDCAEEMAGQFDEQVFIGIWSDSGNLFAIFDGNDWFTK